MANLPLALIEEILSRLSITSLKALKVTCKEWNVLSKDGIFQEKHCSRKAAKEFMAIKLDGFKLLLMSLNLHNHNNSVDPFINQIGKLNQVKVSQVFHCDGLLLCVSKSDPRLMVWNPYLCQIRWIQPIRPSHNGNACINILGYDNNKHHKILRFCTWVRPYRYEIYDFKSGSWRVRYFTPCMKNCGVSLKGNNYFIDFDKCLRCFDFTKERFEKGLLLLPYDSRPEEFVVLSVVKEEQLAVLRCDLFETRIWITTKIEPTTMSWRSLFKVNMNIFDFPFGMRSFFVEENKKVAVICYAELFNHKTCVIQEDGFYQELDCGKSTDQIVMCSYVPSSMWIL